MPSSVLRQYQKSGSSGGVNKQLSTHKKLLPMLCYHIVSDSRDMYLTKNHDEPYSPRMLPVDKNYQVWLSRPIRAGLVLAHHANNPTVEQNKNIKWSGSPWKQCGMKRKSLRRRNKAYSFNVTRGAFVWFTIQAVCGQHCQCGRCVVFTQVSHVSLLV